MLNIIKYVFFFFHIISIIITISFWIWYPEITILQVIAIFSWYLNNNKCLLTQIEDYLLEDNIITIFYKKRDIKNKYIVPKYHRYFLYIIFLANIIYNFIFLLNNY